MNECKQIKQTPLVSICVITYNHEKYIKQAVDSILSQKMSFTYEVLIADDASTDHTQQILRDNYSNIENVRLILREKNVGINGYMTYQEARGKYIYLCEGDDYCVGEDSIQTLVEWLECHEDYAGVCGRRITLSERTGLMTISYNTSQNNTEICLNDVLSGKAVIDMCAILYRNFYSDGKYDYRYYLASRKVSDITREIYVLLHGNIFQLGKIIGVYRSDRIRSASSYNVTNTRKMIFEEYTGLLVKLEELIGMKLEYKEIKKRYTSWYDNSLPSMYEFLKQIPYIQKRVGIAVTMDFIKKRMFKKR
ncbi:MAG: glycosyltransferase family 2 protein [Lachnospiraceae bacterium]|nr:glycosyltransferase family 2 protein [Lachnospiraceae bacterium]